MHGKVTRYVPTAEQYRAIHAKHGVGKGSAISVHDIKTNTEVKLRKPDFLKYIQDHKNGRRSETIIAVGNHPTQNHRVREIVFRKTY